MNYPYHQRSVLSENFVFPISVAAQQTQTYYFKIQSQIPFAIPITANTPIAYMQYVYKSHFILGAYFGLIGVMIFYNLFLFLSIRDLAYLYYVCFIFVASSAELAMTGLAYQLWPTSVELNKLHLFFVTSLTSVPLLQFGRTFLHTKDRMPRLDRFMQLMMIISTLLLLVLIIAPIYSYIPILLAAVMSMSTQFSAGIIIYLSGYKPARFFLIATATFAVGSLVTSLMGLGFIQWTELTRYLFIAGSGCEAVLLSLALAERINLLKKEKYESTEKAALATAKAQAKSDFLARMSHEIRTPMNGVLGVVELLNDTDLQPIQRNYVSVIHNSGRALLGVINDILDHSKIESGKFELENISFKLDQLMQECISIFSVVAKDKNLELKSSVSEETPLYLHGDPTRLRQVLLNLLGNAFKFTSEGHIHLNAYPLDIDQDHCLLRFEVTDTGIGISEENQSKLFGSFVQADESISRRFGGTGLGLMISKQLVKLMGGEIGVISEKNQGSTFWFTAKFELATKEDLQTSLKLDNKSALLLCDNSIIKKISKMLESWGINITVGELKHQSIDMNDDKDIRQVDLIIVDDLFFKIKKDNDFIKSNQHETFSNKPTIILTHQKVDENQISDREFAFAEMVHWPISRQKLRRAIIHTLSRHQEMMMPEEKLDAYHDFIGMRVLVAEDNAENQLVITGFFKKMGVTPLVVENGEKAVSVFKQEKTPFDIIFMDCEMPELDGYSATQQIRQLEQTHLKTHTPIIALTAHAMLEHQQKSLAAGMDDHLSKPFSWDELVSIMYKWTRENKQ